MPLYEIVFHTRNNTPLGPDDPRGAYATRFIRAVGESQAADLGRACLKAEYASTFGWRDVTCDVDSIQTVGFWQYFAKAPGKGSTLYLND